MNPAPSSAVVTIRPALSADSDEIARTFLESASYHAGLDPERYLVPDMGEISARYRQGQQHPPAAHSEAVTYVAELSGRIVGFVDARLDHSPDPMHRDMVYCHVAEFAVGQEHQ